MTKQQTIDYLKDQVESLHTALKAKDESIKALKMIIQSLPDEIEDKQYQNFKESDLAKHIARYVEELISENLRIDGDHKSDYSGYYSLKLEYKDKLISDFKGQIRIYEDWMED